MDENKQCPPRLLSSPTPRLHSSPRTLLYSGETNRIIAAGIEVRKAIGSGFLESIYEEALAIELSARAMPFERQKSIRVRYRERPVGLYRLDFVIAAKVVVEIKAAKAIDETHIAVTLAYLKATGLVVGLILNFGEPILRVRRVGPEGCVYGKSGKTGSGERKGVEQNSDIIGEYEVGK